MIRNAVEKEISSILKLGSDIDPKALNFNNPYIINKVFIVNDFIVGYISYFIMYDKSEIHYLYVKSDYRNQKIATKLLKDMIDDCFSKNITDITLEVRVSNIEAINLYKNHKFKIAGLRSSYYSDGEDAYLMNRRLVI